MAVGTGALSSEAKEVLDSCGLLSEFDCIVGCDQVENGKPAPDTFLLCAQLMGVNPQECIVFEDAVYGLKAAEAAGMLAIDVATHFGVTNDYFLG